MSVDREDLSALVFSAGLVFFGGVLNSTSKLVERIIIGRAFSPEVYGEVAIGLAILSFSVTASLVGFNQGIPRYVSRFEDSRDVRGIWLDGILIAGGISVVLTAVLILNMPTIAASLLDGVDSIRVLQVFALTIPFVVGLRVGIGGIRGLENTVYRTYVNDLLYPGMRILLLVGFLWVGVGIVAPAYAYLVAAGLAFLAAHLLLNRLVSLLGGVRTHTRELVTFSIPLIVSTLFSVLLTQTDTLMLGYFKPSYEVGLYAAAYPLANGLLVILSSFGYLYLPLASRLDAEDKHTEVTAIYRLSTKWIFIVTFPAFLAMLAFSGDVLATVFSGAYRPGGIALAILTVGFFTNAAVGRNRETLSALGHPKGVLLANSVAFGVNLVLNLALIPPYGFVGAAVASATSYVLLNVVVYVLLRQKYGITPFSTYTIRTFWVLPFLMIPPTVLLARWVSLDAVTLVSFLIGSGLIVLAVVAVTGCLQSEDRMALDAIEARTGIRVPLIRRFIPE